MGRVFEGQKIVLPPSAPPADLPGVRPTFARLSETRSRRESTKPLKKGKASRNVRRKKVDKHASTNVSRRSFLASPSTGNILWELFFSRPLSSNVFSSAKKKQLNWPQAQILGLLFLLRIHFFPTSIAPEVSSCDPKERSR